MAQQQSPTGQGRSTGSWVLAQVPPLGNMPSDWWIWFFKEGQELNVCVWFSNFSVPAASAFFFFFNTRHGPKFADWTWPPFCNFCSNGLGSMIWNKEPKEGRTPSYCNLQFLWKEVSLALLSGTTSATCIILNFPARNLKHTKKSRDRWNYFLKYILCISKIIISTCNKYKHYWWDILYSFCFVLNLWNLVCVLYPYSTFQFSC